MINFSAVDHIGLAIATFELVNSINFCLKIINIIDEKHSINFSKNIIT